jgi:hypothetical protein
MPVELDRRYPTLSPIQRKMLGVFSDGMRHSKDELYRCLNDDLAKDTAVNCHISKMRKVLRVMGEEIVCEVFERQFWYRHVLLLPGTVIAINNGNH